MVTDSNPTCCLKKLNILSSQAVEITKTLGMGPCVLALMPLRAEVVGTLNQIFLYYTSPNTHSHALLLWVGTVMIKTKIWWLKSCVSLFQERYIRHIQAHGL